MRLFCVGTIVMCNVDTRFLIYRVDHQSFDVVTVDQVVNKPRKLNTHALSFKQKHLYGDRLKRVDGKPIGAW